MFMYQGCSCPYCCEPLLENEDLAVCPECGTPHHRSCYHEHGHCANEDKHAEGFVWTAPKPAVPAPDLTGEGESKEDYICPNCGEPYAPNDRFCTSCGTVLDQKPRTPNFGAGPMGNAVPFNPVTFLKISNDERIDGIPVRDWIVYFGRNAFSFIRDFKKQDISRSKIGFSLAALLSPAFYFLFYKAWIPALIAFVVSILLSLPDTIIMFAAIFGYVPGGISLASLQNLQNILNIAHFVFVVFCALLGCYIVRVFSAKRIRAIRRKCDNDNDYLTLLRAKGCPSKLAIALLVIAAITMVIGLFGTLLL